jgi:hypothetical protein
VCSAWRFADPLHEAVSDEERGRLFAKVFWQIVRQVSGLIEAPLEAGANGAALPARAQRVSACDV